MTIPRPKHLGPKYADQFKDRSVAAAYVNYPPYAPELFQVLAGLIQDEPRIVLDMGCGTGDVARPLAALVERVDAVDPSAAMLEVGRARARAATDQTSGGSAGARRSTPTLRVTA